MKILRVAGKDGLLSDADEILRLSVCEASILTGYFERSVRPMLCIDNENRIIPPSEKLDANLPKPGKYEIRAQWVYEGVIDATDEELAVLRQEGGYRVRDLRTTSVSNLLTEMTQ